MHILYDMWFQTIKTPNVTQTRIVNTSFLVDCVDAWIGITRSDFINYEHNMKAEYKCTLTSHEKYMILYITPYFQINP